MIDSKAAEFRLKQSKGGLLSKSLDLTANYGHENIIKYGSSNNTQLMARDATAKITQTITDFGLTDSTVKTSELSLKQSLALEKQIKMIFVKSFNSLFKGNSVKRKCKIC